ncbi:MAG: response regulator [Puniceicoccales bacterium]
MNKRRILVVDDNPLDRGLITQYLGTDQEFTNQVLEAANADEALNYCRTVKVDAIVLDLQLPGMQGLDFILELRRTFKALCWPIVVLTGHGDEATAVEAMKRGAQDYLKKPTLSPDRLLRSLNNAIERMAFQRATEEKLFRLQQANKKLEEENARLRAELGKSSRV